MLNLDQLSERELAEFEELLEQEERESVSPKMERFREPWRIKIAHGGRGSGAKSWSAASLLIQKAHRENLRICCLREVQKSLEESSYRLMVDTISRLRYTGWKITKEALNSPSGSHIIFRGLVDMKAAGQMKSLEGFSHFWLEEAASITTDSIRILLPTLRKPGSELWATLNRETEHDPIYDECWLADREDVLRIALEPGKIDNPWFPDVLQQEMETAYRINPAEADHVWGGEPRDQSENSILSRVKIKAAMTRKVEETEPDQIGVDVARFGNDNSEIYRRRGGKVIAHKTLSHKDTIFVANTAWDMAGRDRKVVIKCDVGGLGVGTVDKLRELGANVVEVNFGGSPSDKKSYTSVADELWMLFAEIIDEVEIPNDPQLMEELAGRLYTFDKLGRRKVESKDDFKKRFGRSPDRADALLMCFWQGWRRSGTVTAVQTQGI
jgi:phage terminase large subunit